MYIRNALVTIAGTLMLVGTAAPAVAASVTNFGTHVRDCHNSMTFSGLHNPGMPRGAAGWDGRPCP